MATNSKRLPDRRSEATADPEAVAAYLKALAHPLKPEIEALRKIILKADPRITEGIKWNAPSFYCGDWFATFDLRSKERVQIILHRGAKAKSPTGAHYVKDPAGVLQWITADRAVARFLSSADVAEKGRPFGKVVTDWADHLAEESKPA